MWPDTGNSSRLGIAVLCVAQFVVVLDVTIVATALPAIGADLDVSGGSLAAVVTAYTVAMAGLLVLGGRGADVRGAAATFRWALAGFGRLPARLPGRHGHGRRGSRGEPDRARRTRRRGQRRSAS
jgi:MFS family permease